MLYGKHLHMLSGKHPSVFVIRSIALARGSFVGLLYTVPVLCHILRACCLLPVIYHAVNLPAILE
jgi:hypothetical protein